MRERVDFYSCCADLLLFSASGGASENLPEPSGTHAFQHISEPIAYTSAFNIVFPLFADVCCVTQNLPLCVLHLFYNVCWQRGANVAPSPDRQVSLPGGAGHVCWPVASGNLPKTFRFAGAFRLRFWSSGSDSGVGLYVVGYE